MEGTWQPVRRPAVPFAEAADPFLRAVRCPSGRVDVLGAALALALDGRPDADVEEVRETLDEWGARLARTIRDSRARHAPITGALLLCRLLFDEEGFSGDADTPQDPANSELDLVLARRLGLPLTLGLVMIEVGKRAGLPLHGLSFPGRFLVGLAIPPRPLLLDPFRQGSVVLPEQCQGLAAERTRDGLRLRQEFLQPCPPRRLVERLVTQLKNAHVRAGDLNAAIRVQGRLVDLSPSHVQPLQERAWLAFQAGRHVEAVQDLESASLLARDGEAAGEVKRQLAQVRRWAAAMG